MAEKPVISLIVPVYNVKDYLHRCLKSIESQTYSNIEVILVDDGSTDGSNVICDDFAKGKENVVVIHQKNAGLSMARNNGVKASTGMFITFVDSDDYIDKSYVEFLYSLITENKADISIGKTRLVYGTETVQDKNEEKIEISLFNSEEAISKMCYSQGFSVSAWAKMYKRELVERYPYPKGRLYEDLFTTYKMFGDSNKIVYGNKIIYYWFQRRNGITYGNITDKQLDGVVAAKEQLEYIRLKYPNIRNAGIARCASKIVDLVPKTLNRKDKDYFDKLQDEVKPYLITILRDKNVRKTVKLRCIALRLGYIPSKLVFGIHGSLKQRILDRK